MHVAPHPTADEWAELARTERRPEVARRLGAIRLAVLGDTAPDIAEDTRSSERAVRGWVARYNAGRQSAIGSLLERVTPPRSCGYTTPASPNRSCDMPADCPSL